MKGDYERRFCLLSARVEKVLFTLIVCLAVLLVAGQAAYQVAPIRHMLVETERWEGVSAPR
ncbi:hypothetical protein LOK74_10065 [Brevibacillus humidisoli]|uniref:hypothetical protein n=1 Tax=Brevibacillus humidisoli TaxID=2895522 RepID=UPI001E2FF7A9|nr:hypothetical protein [Brevibacillus humidisoli]UFJ42807.1 hypothetical protein LOK74_10065 [Brevibacillus humidisoli]